MLTSAVGQGQLVLIHDRPGLAAGDRAYRDQSVPGRVQGPGPERAIVARGVQQRALPGQPQIKLRVELRHPLMLSRPAAIPGPRRCSRGRGLVVNVSL